ncbi:hypothetical protein [Metamycoplasma auris]|nr:hypothetical protein [Metamycoplasma auris]
MSKYAYNLKKKVIYDFLLGENLTNVSKKYEIAQSPITEQK